MADLSTIHPTKPSGIRVAFFLTPSVLLLVAAAAAPRLFGTNGTPAGLWPWAVLALLVAVLALLALDVYARTVSLVWDGASLVHSGLLGRRRVMRPDRLTEVVGRRVRAWVPSIDVRVVVFREGDRDAGWLLAANWDLDALDRLADDLRLPIRNECVRPRLLRPRTLYERLRLAA